RRGPLRTCAARASVRVGRRRVQKPCVFFPFPACTCFASVSAVCTAGRQRGLRGRAVLARQPRQDDGGWRRAATGALARTDRASEGDSATVPPRFYLVSPISATEFFRDSAARPPSSTLIQP